MMLPRSSEVGCDSIRWGVQGPHIRAEKHGGSTGALGADAPAYEKVVEDFARGFRVNPCEPRYLAA